MTSDEESETGDSTEDLQSLLKESNKKITEDTREKRRLEAESTKRAKEREREEQAKTMLKKQAGSGVKGKQPAFSTREEYLRNKVGQVKTNGLEPVKREENRSVSKEVRREGPSSSSKERIQILPKDRARSSRPLREEVGTGRTKNGPSTLREDSKAFSRRKEPPAREAEVEDDDSDASVDTVVKQTSNKKKKKHKLSMFIWNHRAEISLLRHFTEIGEWRKVYSPDEADFTYVFNERKLNWEIAHRTMVSTQ